MGKALGAHRDELNTRGYTLMGGPADPSQVPGFLENFGTLVRQPDGTLANGVRASPGFADRHHTKSPNAIQVHTEAPGWRLPPHYLALHCRVQAVCGGGQTELADMDVFIASLGEDLRQLAAEREIDWSAYPSEDPEDTGVRRPIIERVADRQIIRMSYNLLKTGAYAPPVDESPNPPLGAEGADLAERVVEFFHLSKTSMLIPEGAILLWNNQRMLRARSAYRDLRRHLTRYWLATSVAAA